MSAYNRILVIRRDNIGDLVCTLPMIRRLRERYPDAWIGALVTRYNAEVLHDNPDLDAVFAYTKSKHLMQGESRLGALWQRLRVLWRLRHADLDLVLLPASGSQASAQRMARLVGAKRIIAQDDVPPESEGFARSGAHGEYAECIECIHGRFAARAHLSAQRPASHHPHAVRHY